MDVYLIRHGETVDNVAGLYAGVRNSALTNHGHDQAQRLGSHFAHNGIVFTHIFASPLMRALKTAQAIQNPQSSRDTNSRDTTNAVEIVEVHDLIEQDFGYYEGKPFHARAGPKKTGREAHGEIHKDGPGFVDVESKESMGKRADAFLDNHLLPLFHTSDASASGVVAVVSHGMLLSNLWRRLLLRLPSQSVTIASDVTAIRGDIVLQHLGGWSNTGYLELSFSRAATIAIADLTELVKPLSDSTVDSAKFMNAAEGRPESSGESSSTDEAKKTNDFTEIPLALHDWSLLIRAIDKKDHLGGLKRQRGGIGRSAHDEGQRKLDSFFKKQRTS